MNLPIEKSRPGKLTHAQTVLYEIDMLRFAASDFREAEVWSSWRNLECFLLHFRNLIEFFGNPKPWPDDLTIRKPETIWPDAATRPSAETLKQLQREDLWTKYEVRDAGDKISRYLQHCTEQRVDKKNWTVKEMFEELSPLMGQFENLLPGPDRKRPWGDLPANDSIHSLPNAAHTATIIGPKPPFR